MLEGSPRLYFPWRYRRSWRNSLKGSCQELIDIPTGCNSDRATWESYFRVLGTPGGWWDFDWACLVWAFQLHRNVRPVHWKNPSIKRNECGPLYLPNKTTRSRKNSVSGACRGQLRAICIPPAKLSECVLWNHDHPCFSPSHGADPAFYRHCLLPHTALD